MYDLIGDIHGHATELKQLLEKLGYKPEKGLYRHGERKVIFLGDFIDRGKEIREVLEIVRPMIDSGEAMAVMGNHEFNALAYHTPDPDKPDGYLRRHVFVNKKTGEVDPKNLEQHLKTLQQIPDDELSAYLDWFRKLPLWLELAHKGDRIRVVHACWDEKQIRVIENWRKDGDDITNEFLTEASRKGTELYEAVECVLKGPEIRLPPGCEFEDKDENKRTNVRIRWYRPTCEEETYRTYALMDLSEILRKPENKKAFRKKIDPSELKSLKRKSHHYPNDAPPLFIGHYWLRRALEDVSNVACMDYSVAKGGSLCAYPWDGEQELDIGKIKSVPAKACPHMRK